MKYKKILLIVLLLAMFVFQQVNAGANTSTEANTTSKIAGAQSFVPCDPNNPADANRCVWVYIFHLQEPGGQILGDPPTKCWTGDTAFGCGEAGSGGYQDPLNPAYVDIEHDYLPDVLAREMNVAENYPALEALKAQTLASRTVLKWKAVNQFYTAYWHVNNSIDYQVFNPYAYEYYKNPDDPVGVQQMISTAISSTNGQYLSYQGAGQTIDAEFGGDFIGQSADEPSKDYLNIVQDPISTDCARQIYNGWGMSSAGAIRWSRGNQCATKENAPWPVTWTDYRQILVHYYTGNRYFGAKRQSRPR